MPFLEIGSFADLAAGRTGLTLPLCSESGYKAGVLSPSRLGEYAEPA